MRRIKDIRFMVSRYVLLIVTVALLLIASCSPGKYLKTETVSEVNIRGSYTLFLYNDWMNRKIAVFDVEGDGYTFVMSGSPFNYVSAKGVTAENALASAVLFMDQQRNRWQTIKDDSGNIIGYDFRPLYHTTRYGISDILDVAYRVDNGKVTVSVDLKQSAQGLFYQDIFGIE